LPTALSQALGDIYVQPNDASVTFIVLYCSRNQENNRGADAANTAVTVTRRIYEEAITMNENNIETKELNEQDTEKVTGGTIDWRHFPKEVKDAIEKEQQKDGGATGSW
jgi:hypothetical protein